MLIRSITRLLLSAFLLLGTSVSGNCSINSGGVNSCQGLAHDDSEAGIRIQGPFLIEHEGYTVCYDGRTKNPICVHEHLTQEDLSGASSRKECFCANPLLPSHVCSCLLDYRGSGFDRGHLAAAANHKRTETTLDETFYLSNISPQVSIGFNRAGGLWHSLEGYVRDAVRKHGTAHVISGPLFLPMDQEDGSRVVQYAVIGRNDVAVPTHFFKILICKLGDGSELMEAWVLPNQPRLQEESFQKYRVSVKEALRLAGLSIE